MLVKGTRLWQNTGSPLISGRSRRERPFWHQVLLAWLFAVTFIAAAVAVLSMGAVIPASRMTAFGYAGQGALVVGGVAYGAVPSLVGSVFGVWLARNMGWRRPWLAGLAAACAGAILWIGLSLSSM